MTRLALFRLLRSVRSGTTELISVMYAPASALCSYLQPFCYGRYLRVKSTSIPSLLFFFFTPSKEMEVDSGTAILFGLVNVKLVLGLLASIEPWVALVEK